MHNRLVFVAGLTHSGSTVLDLLLGAHPRFVGLGEVVPLLRSPEKLAEADRECSCGRRVGECPFWGPAREVLGRRPEGTVVERYTALLGVFREVFGEGAIPVDSSKSLRALQTVAEVPGLDLRVLHLIRDVRSWTISRLDTDVRREMFAVRDLYRLHGSRAWRWFMLRNAYARFVVWYRGNRRIQEYLREQALPSFQVGYEEFSLDPEQLAGQIFAFLGVEPPPAGAELAESKSHIALGNFMRLRRDKQVRITYDSRWFYRTEWMLPSLLFRRIMRYNRQNVYRNTNRS